MHTTITLALVFDLADTNGADFARIIDVRAAARLEVDMPSTRTVRMSPAPLGGCTDIVRTSSGRSSSSASVIVPKTTGCASADQPVDPCRQVLPYVIWCSPRSKSRRLFSAPTEPPVTGTGNQRTEQVHARVHAHVFEASLPVDLGFNRVTGREAVIRW